MPVISARPGDQVEAVEPVVGGLGEHEDAEQDRELDLGGAGQPVVRRLQPDPAVQVVHERGHQQRDHENAIAESTR